MWFLLVADILVAIAGLGWFFLTGNAEKFIRYNQMLAALGLAILLATVSIPSLSRRFLVLSQHRVLTIGTFVFAIEALWVNLGRPFRVEVPAIYSSLGFAILLLSFAYVALDLILANERSLLAINNELAIARQLQFSILPAAPPQVRDLTIAAAYEPMTSVAGDFYEFLPVDNQRAGFLVADVSGHGVPAALIASMIKVATQSMDGCTSDPASVLRRLSSTLSKNVQGQLVSAAYLWLDTASRTALYSAAGHPPLIRWNRNSGTLTRIESNGLILSIAPQTECPVCTIPLVSGDRFLLYTDGITEPENIAGEQFGDRKLEQILRASDSLPAPDLLQSLIRQVRAWQPESVPQQDDMTLIVIDVL
jgi:sigma-B regulation protein RsbU (phosphoserine phosphatase)